MIIQHTFQCFKRKLISFLELLGAWHREGVFLADREARTLKKAGEINALDLHEKRTRLQTQSEVLLRLLSNA